MTFKKKTLFFEIDLHTHKINRKSLYIKYTKSNIAWEHSTAKVINTDVFLPFLPHSALKIRKITIYCPIDVPQGIKLIIFPKKIFYKNGMAPKEPVKQRKNDQLTKTSFRRKPIIILLVTIVSAVFVLLLHI